MARSRKDQRQSPPKPPPSYQTTISCGNTSVSSYNESPQFNVPTNIRLPDSKQSAIADVDAVDASDADNSVIDRRASVFDYPEWVQLVPIDDDNCDNSTKQSKKDGKTKDGWMCMFWKSVFLGRNATKVICHLAGVPRMNIKVCTGPIPPKHMKRILDFNDKGSKKAKLSRNTT